MNNGEVVTVGAAALAMGVSRIILERAIKAKGVTAHSFHTGSKDGAGFRLIPVDSFKGWLKGRKGYHESLRGGATKFHAWGVRVNPEAICVKAVAITNGK